MKEIKNKTEFAKLHDISKQALNGRLKSGWVIGELKGVYMYQPKSVMKVKSGASDAGDINSVDEKFLDEVK